MTRTVSAEYLDGIREGRDYLRRFQPTRDDMQRLLENCSDTLRGFNGGPVADLLRGERDFWRHQLAKRDDGLTEILATETAPDGREGVWL